MADKQGNHLQRDFSGGEIGPAMYMRDDLLIHTKSVATMTNFLPTQQGTAARTPGTKFIQEVLATNARIMPYITPSGKHSIVVLTPQVGATKGNLTILDNIGGVASAPTSSLTYGYVGKNGSFVDGLAEWSALPIDYVSSKNNTLLGWHVESGFLTLRLRKGHHVPSGDPASATVAQGFVIPETTNHIVVTPDIRYVSNFGQGDGKNYGATVKIRVGTTWNGSEITQIIVTDLKPGDPSYKTSTVVNGTFTAGVTYYITLEISPNAGPGGDGDAINFINFRVDDLNVLALVTTAIGSNILTAVVEYGGGTIQDVHYVQSPYTAKDIGAWGVGKELVMTVATHPPSRLYFGGVNYAFNYIFTDDATQHYNQWSWPTNGYPATCTSYNGRLVLAGSTDGNILSPKGSSAETVWCTEVGDWAKFTLYPDDISLVEVLPTDSVSFTAIYRSQIRWAMGSTTLLLGAEGFEYTASADVIFQPGDIGVNMHSTHGSNKVQPVAMGSYVMFSADAGYRMRSMRYQEHSLQYVSTAQGWVATDLTMTHPGMLNSKILRMVRMRNPQQMVVCVLGNGQLAIKSYDSDAGLDAWSRINVGGIIIDAAVVVAANGEDILCLLVRRTVAGVTKLFLEAIVNWAEAKKSDWQYMNSYVQQINPTPSNVVNGLSHLNGQYVQVMADGNYQGTYLVAGGVVTLLDQLGAAINFTTATAGVSSPCQLRTLPMVTEDPKSKKRFTSLVVRVLSSIRPIINGERVADREPAMPLDNSQYYDLVYDCEVAPMESDRHQVIDIQETVPMRVEVTGIFGKLTGSST